MTSALISPAELSEFEFSIPCEFPGCRDEATVMSKGCADSHHRAICTRHLHGVQQFFRDNLNKVCKDCHRPWVHFDTHYDIHAI